MKGLSTARPATVVSSESRAMASVRELVFSIPRRLKDQVVLKEVLGKCQIHFSLELLI